MNNAGVLTLFDATSYFPFSYFYTQIVKHANLVILKIVLTFQE